MTRFAMSRIGTWFPLRRAHHVYAHRRISRSGAMIFEPRRRRSSESVVLAKPVTVSTASSFAGSCPAWVVVVPINVLERDFRRQMLASSAAVALSPCHFIVLLFDTTRIR
jgi:hypothetical protein